MLTKSSDWTQFYQDSQNIMYYPATWSGENEDHPGFTGQTNAAYGEEGEAEFFFSWSATRHKSTQ
jgi:hypothetical protein